MEMWAKVFTSGLTAGAYTIWVVIFNQPENCAGGSGKCGGGELTNPAVEGSIVYGTGSIVGEDKVANFHGSLSEGAPPAGISVNVPAGTFNGLKDSRKAEIHLVVRAHGAVKTGEASLQLSTFGTCAECKNVQGARFEAVE